MSTNDADRLLTAWLTTVAPTREPEHLLDTVLATTARTPRRPAWRIPERWIPMATTTTRVAVGGRVPWPLVAAVAIVALALVAGLVILAGSRTPRVPPPFGPAGNGALVYESNGNLVTADLASGRTASVTSGSGLEIQPQFSRDGTRLAWLSAADIADLDPHLWSLRVGQTNGTGARDIGTYDEVSWYQWAPSGDTIAIASVIDGQPAISMVDVASGKATVLALGIEAERPTFRPGTGSQLVVRGKVPDGYWGLYLAGADGTHLLRLGLDPGFEQDADFAINREFYFMDPAWSPDGSRLAYHTLEDSTTGEDPGFRVHVATIGPGGEVTAETTLPTDPAIDDEFQPAWLPDGSGLVAHRVEEGVHSLVRWPVEADLRPGTPIEISLGGLTAATTDLRFVVAPDGSAVLAWQPGEHAQLVPLSGGPAADAGVVPADSADWQRTAP